MQRRHFLAASAALAACSPAWAIPPLTRSIPGNMQLSLSAYSFRNQLNGKDGAAPELDLFGFVDYCGKQKLPGTELTSYYFPTDVDDAYILKLKRHCHLAGVSVSGGAIRNDFCSQDADTTARDIEHTKRWIDRYALLGAPAIRIFAGHQPQGEERSVTIGRCIKNCQIVSDYAAQRGVMLALENHGGVTKYADDLLKIVQGVDSPAFGINLDSGNFRSELDPYAELAKVSPYAVNAQVKIHMVIDGKIQDADLPRVAKILREAGYSGWVALEYESSRPYEAIPGWLEKLQVALA